MSIFFFFCVWCPIVLALFVKKTIFSSWSYLRFFVEISWLYLCGSISEFFILLHWSIYPFFLQYHTVFLNFISFLTNDIIHLETYVQVYFIIFPLWLIYHVLSISSVQQSDPVIYIYDFFSHHHIYSFSHIIPYRVPSQVTRYSSLCYTAGSHCLSTPNAIVASINLRLTDQSTRSPSPLATISLFSKSMRSPPPPWKGSFVTFIRFQI